MKNDIQKYINHKFVISAFMLAMLFIVSLPYYARALTVSDVEEYLMSASCPGEALSKCKSGPSDQRRAEIKEMIEAGMTKDEILQSFVKKYGEGVLTIPPKKGFNLVAYIAPSVGLVIGIVIVFFLLKKWGVSAETGSAEIKVSDLSSEMQKKIDDELSKLEEEDE